MVLFMVFVPAGANPAHVAADLLSQAEHGPDSQVVLLTLPGTDVQAISREVTKQCDALPRNTTARKALTHSYVIQCSSTQQAIDFSNMYASEHLIVNVEDAESWLPHIDHAGSVFLGR